MRSYYLYNKVHVEQAAGVASSGPGKLHSLALAACRSWPIIN